jgi:hypothetical protein
MSDYYQMPATPKRKRENQLDGLALFLLLLLVLAVPLTLWSLRAVPGEAVIVTASAPAETQALPPIPEAEPVDVPPPVEAAAPEPEPVAEPEPPPPLFSDARWREAAKFTGLDAAGRTAEFTAYILVGEETWTFARADAIFAAGLDEPVETAFANLNLGPGACTLTRVIAIGAASVEGTAERNTFLSRARGEALGNAIAANLPCEAGAVPMGVLDLGYSTAPVACPAGEALCPALSAPQRPIAMVLAAAIDPETDIGEALRSGIAAQEESGASVLPGVMIRDYSGYETAFDRF